MHGLNCHYISLIMALQHDYVNGQWLNTTQAQSIDGTNCKCIIGNQCKIIFIIMHVFIKKVAS